jgi:hypothetical protein
LKFPKKFIELKSSILLKRDAFFILFFTCLVFFIGYSGEAKSQSLLQKFDLSYLKYDTLETADSLKSGDLLKDTIIKKDTLINKSSIDSEKKKNVKFEMKKSPWKAVFLSAVLPGLGQIYNESYWKLPIVAVVGGSLAYYFFYNNGKYLNYRDLYENSQTPANPYGDERYKRLRESYRDARDQNLLYFMIFYLINLADAYVDAHLYDFNVSSKMKVGMFQKGNLASFKIIF